MKSALENWKEPESWTIYVAGDWRRETSQGRGYDEAKGGVDIWISGAEGLYWFGRWELPKAIRAWQADLRLILQIEQTEGERLHKGWFYYHIYRAYWAQGREALARRYLALAHAEDVLSYGEKALGFPAATEVAKEN